MASVSASFAEISAKFGSLIQKKTDEVDKELEDLKGRDKLTAAQTTDVTRMVAELSIMTQQMMNGMKTIKSNFDKINDVGRN